MHQHLFDGLRCRLTLQNRDIGALLPVRIHGLELRQDGRGGQGGVCFGCPTVVLWGFDDEDDAFPGVAEGIDRLAEAFASTPSQRAVARFAACIAEVIFDLGLGGLAAFADDVIPADVDCHNLGRMSVEELYLLVEKFVECEARDAGMLKMRLVWDGRHVLKDSHQIGRAKLKVSCTQGQHCWDPVFLSNSQPVDDVGKHMDQNL